MFKLQAFKKSVLATLVGLLGFSQTHATTVRSDVDYQEFRDFAENKGRFTVGKTNISIQNKKGKNLGAVLGGVPMIDFSSTESNIGTKTLIDPQYVVTVAHNQQGIPGDGDHHEYAQFGGQSSSADNHRYNYAVVDDNIHSTYQPAVGDTRSSGIDLKAPRLAKLVTEVNPITMAVVGDKWDYITDRRYKAFARVGAGVQNVLDADGTTQGQGRSVCEGSPQYCKKLSSSYRYLIGGEALKFIDGTKQKLVAGGPEAYGVNHVHSSPMANFNEAGDSGSPFFGFNVTTKQWELISVHGGRQASGYVGDVSISSYSIPIQADFVKQSIAEDTITVNNHRSNNEFKWTSRGSASDLVSTATGKTAVGLSSADAVSKSGIRKQTVGLNSGKTINFKGQEGTLTLQNSINQGAGALHFDENFTVKSQNINDTWLGAGVVVANGKTINWQVKNPENDRLSKLGKGTLHVNGTGDNLGDISVGDGVVILNQTNGKAFKEVGIVSGRGTVVLAKANQVNPDDIYFGYRGGRLDLNGNDLTFKYIQNVDDGAQIVNHNRTKSANVTVINREEVNNTKFRLYSNGYRLRGDNERVVTIQGNPIPEVEKSNLDWVHVSNASREARVAEYNRQMNALNRTVAFNGVLGETDKNKYNGQLDFNFSPINNDPNNATLMLSGGSNLNGNISSQAGTLLLSGRPTPHAIDKINSKDVVKEDDWLNRIFNATNIISNGNSKLTVGRNVSELNANITVNDTAIAQIGFINGATPVCIRSDYHGETTCETPNYTHVSTLASIPTTQFKGDININQNANLTLGKVKAEGKATSSSNISKMTMSPDARWTMTGDSDVGHLSMQKGSQITLNSATKDTLKNYHTLMVKGNLTGAGQFNYLTDLTEIKGDKVDVLGDVDGVFKLNVANTGKEPAKVKEHLTVFSARGSVSQAPTLINDVVDMGAFRYALKSDNSKDYYLWSEGLEQKIDNDEADIRKKAEEARLKAESERKSILAAQTTVNNLVSDAQMALVEAKKTLDNAITSGASQATIDSIKGQITDAEISVGKAIQAQTSVYNAKTSSDAEKLVRQVKQNKEQVVNVQNAVNNILQIYQAEEEARRKAEEEARRKAEEEANLNKEAGLDEEEARRKAEEEAKRKAEEEARLKAEEEAKRKAEEEARRKAEEEAKRKAEEEARRKAEEEANLNKEAGLDEEEARRKAEEEAKRKAEEEARRKAEEEAKRKAEEEAKRKAEEEAKRKAEEEAKRKAEEEARLKAEEEAKRKAEEEARLKAEEEAKRKVEEEARRQADEVKTKIGIIVAQAEQRLDKIKALVEKAKQSGLNASKIATAEAEVAKAQQSLQEAKVKQQNLKQEAIIESDELIALQVNSDLVLLTSLESTISTLLQDNQVSKKPNTVTQAQTISRYTNTALSELSSQVNNVIHIANGLNHHFLTAEGSGVWLAGSRYKNNHKSDLYRAYNKEENVMQLGAGQTIDVTQGKLLLGGAWSQSKADNRYDDGIQGKSELNMFSVYGKLSFHDDTFVTADVGYGKSKNQINSSSQNIDFKRNISTAGVNIGKIFRTSVIDIQPSVGVRYHYLSDVNYSLNDAKIHVDDVNLVSYRAGVLFEKSIPLADGLSFKPSVASYYVDTQRDRSSGMVKMNDNYDFKQKFGRYGYHQIGLTLAHRLWDINLNASHTEGNEIDKQQSVGFKLNYKW